jgi:hypothetical protein
MGEFGVLFCLFLQKRQQGGLVGAMDFEYFQPNMPADAGVVCPV